MISKRDCIFALFFVLLLFVTGTGICSQDNSKEQTSGDCLQEKDNLKETEYWQIKDAFNNASRSWNIKKSQEPDSHFFVASNVIDCLRSEYVTAVNKLWPT